MFLEPKGDPSFIFRVIFANAKLATFLSNVGSSKNLARAPFQKMTEAGLKIAQKGL